MENTCTYTSMEASLSGVTTAPWSGWREFSFLGLYFRYCSSTVKQVRLKISIFKLNWGNI